MQEGGEVGWDPMSVRYSPGWALRLFVLYVLGVVAVAFVRSLRLGMHLWLFPNRKLARFGQSTENGSLASITAAAFTRKFREILKADVARNFSSPLWRKEAHFLYFWQLYLVKVQSIKKLAILTIMVSVWVFLAHRIEMFSYIGIQKITSIGLMSGGIVQSLTSLELGIVSAMLLYAQYALLEGALRRRKLAWDFVVKSAEQRTEYAG